MFSPPSEQFYHPIRLPHACTHQNPSLNPSLLSITFHLRALPCSKHLLCSRRHNSYLLETDKSINLRRQPESELDEIGRRITDEFSLDARRAAKFPGAVDFPKPYLPEVDLQATFNSSVEQDRYQVA